MDITFRRYSVYQNARVVNSLISIQVKVKSHEYLTYRCISEWTAYTEDAEELEVKLCLIEVDHKIGF